ncbi:MAG: AraC family transcriptional regulator ligand-binding domain-containing protein [Gammaproteobacteria bacterium]|nr:AraC family transcriptional regulator ligand-binding domain-containing protein [Gammaproteobacteria bacterium]
MRLAYPQPANIAAYQRRFDCPLYFDQPRTLVCFDIQHLNDPRSAANSGSSSSANSSASTTPASSPRAMTSPTASAAHWSRSPASSRRWNRWRRACAWARAPCAADSRRTT